MATTYLKIVYGQIKKQQANNRRMNKLRKINFKIAEKIRNEYKLENISQKKLANKFNISRGIVRDVIKNRTY